MRANLAVAGLAVVAAVATSPCLAASASTNPPATVTRPGPAAVAQATGPSQAEPGLVLRAARGHHAVSETIGAAPRADRVAAAGASPDWSVKTGVSVRVGKNNCGGFKGEVEWGADSGANATWMTVYGDLWSNCDAYTASTVYLYFKWSNAGSDHNDMIGSVNAGTVGIDTDQSHPYDDLLAAKPEAIDTCLKWNTGWGCGPAQNL